MLRNPKTVGLSVRLEVWRPIGNILSTCLAQKVATDLAVLWGACLAKHTDTLVSRWLE